jgi:type IV fimbrial biogenesis protein FimT
MLNHPSQRGFNIIELMVAVSIMAGLMLIGIPSFSTWLQNSQIRTAAEAMQNGVHIARAEAVRRNAPVIFQITNTLTNACALSTTGQNWVVSMDSAAGSCASSPSADLASPTSPRIIQKRSGSDGAKNAVISAGQSSITFNGLGRVTPVPAGSIQIDISNTTGGSCSPAGPMRCMRVVVSPAGQVRLCDPQLASTDAQGC